MVLGEKVFGVLKFKSLMVLGEEGFMILWIYVFRILVYQTHKLINL